VSGTKFSSKVPKGEGWGVEDSVRSAADQFEHTGASPLIPCIAIIGIDKVVTENGEEGPVRTAVVKLVRIEALTTPKAIREAQKLILRAVQARNQTTGQPMLPFEEDEILRMAFGGVDVDKIEQDEREEIEDQNLTDLDRLRRHLVAVHGKDQTEIDRMEVTDVRELHDVEHNRLDDPDTDVEVIQHDRENWSWRRVEVAEMVDVAAAVAEDGADGDGVEVPDDARSLTGEGDTDGAEDADSADDNDTADDTADDRPDDITPVFEAPQTADGDERD
jgi:hypothetical protein